MSCVCYSREGIKKRRFHALEWLATVASYASIKREGVMESNVYVPQAARLKQVPARSFTSTIPKSGIVSIMEVHGSNLCSPPDLRLRIVNLDFWSAAFDSVTMPILENGGIQVLWLNC
jgi:hypothetical protein